MERNVPKLRFKEFSDEWEKKHLSNMVERVVRKNKDNRTQRPLTISAQYGLVDQEEFFNKIVASKNLEGYYLLEKGEFAYNKSYSNGYPFGTIKRLDRYDNGAVSTLYICFNNKENYNSDYLVQYFESSKWHREVSMIAVEGARNHGLLNVSVPDFFDTIHRVPSLQEQERIANFLTKVDKIIEKQDEKVKNLEKYKKGMMQKIFSQEIRFKDENGDEYPEWEYCTIKKICSIKKKSILPKQFPKTNFYEYSMPAYDKCKEPEFVTGDMMNSSRIELSGPVILFNKLNVHKKRIWSIKEVNENSICSAEFIPIVANSINQDFLYCKLISDQITEYVKSISTGSSNSQKRINSEDLLNVEIGVPVKDEQEKISSCIINIESMVLKETEKLKELKRWKKGLLQQMFV